MATVEEFVQQYGPTAARAGKALKVDPSILLGQWGLETGWGKSVIPGTHNLGNIKDFSGGGTLATDNATGSQDKYRTYANPDAFADDYTSLIQRKYPQAIGLGDDAVKFGRALKFGGYAEDPAYVSKVSSATGMVRGLGEKLANFLIPTASAETLPTAQTAPGRMQTLEQALMKADAAGNAADAKALADEIRRLRGAATSTQPPQEGGSAQGEYLPDGGYHVTMSHTGPAGSAPAPQEPSLWDRLLRQGGLTLRAGLTGVAALPEAIVNPIASMAGLPEMHLSDTLDSIGLPKPENSTERVAQDVAGAMAGAGGISKLGAIAAEKEVAPVARAVAELFGKNAGTQIASGGAAAGASGGAREGGAGPLTQAGLGLLAGAGPSMLTAGTAATVRGAVRGGEAGRQQVADAIESFRRAGTTPTVGQATGRPIIQGLETVLSQSPGSAGIMARKAASQADDISGAVNKIADRLSPSAGTVEAGESISRGLEGFKAGVKSLQNQLYDRLDMYLPPSTPVRVSRTQEALAALNSDIEGAEALSKMFKNGRIQGIERALSSDLDQSARAQIPAGGSLFNPPKPDLSKAAIPYTSIKKLRTLVGKEIDNASFVSDVPRDKWRALYAALSEDLGDAAREAGPDAYGAWRWANKFSKDQLSRLDDLASVAGRDTPEKLFNAAMMGSVDGDTILKRIVSAIPKTNRRDLAGAVVRRMGRATAGNQNDVGDTFSTSTFLTNWNKLSPEARSTLFGRIGEAGLLDELMNLAKVSSNIRDGSRYLANPSGTAPAAARQAALGAGALAGMTGQWGVLGAMGAGLLTANRAGKVLTSPRSVRLLSERTKLNTPAMVQGAIQALFPNSE